MPQFKVREADFEAVVKRFGEDKLIDDNGTKKMPYSVSEEGTQIFIGGFVVFVDFAKEEITEGELNLSEDFGIFKHLINYTVYRLKEVEGQLQADEEILKGEFDKVSEKPVSAFDAVQHAYRALLAEYKTKTRKVKSPAEKARELMAARVRKFLSENHSPAEAVRLAREALQAEQVQKEDPKQESDIQLTEDAPDTELGETEIVDVADSAIEAIVEDVEPVTPATEEAPPLFSPTEGF